MMGTGTAMLVSAGIGTAASLYGAKKEGDRANRAQAARDQLLQREMDFAEARQEKWDAVFGPIQQNLGDYYRNLDAGTIAAMGLEQYEMEREQATDRIEKNLAQRGLTESGAAVAIQAQGEFDRSRNRAQIRAEAPMRAAQEQSNFLALGLQSDPSGNTQQVMGRQTDVASQDLQRRRQIADQASAQAGQAVSDFSDAVIGRFTESE